MEIVKSVSEPLTFRICDSSRSVFSVENNVYRSNVVGRLNNVSVVITKEKRRAKAIDIFLDLGLKKNEDMFIISKKNYVTLLYACVLQGLGTTEFTNLIG